MTEPFSTGKVISHYRIMSRLGAGGMGEVYLAEDLRLGRKVALKLLPAQYMRDEDRVRRFEQEARAASALNHPNILTIYEIGQAGGVHFIVTEFIEGGTLRQRLARGPLPLSETLEVAIQAASALNAAHEAGIVHRDVKPENIMLRPDGYVKVLDFGLAKLTERAAPPADPEALTLVKAETDPGTVMGTAHYMSPEQARGTGVDARTDIFSLGIVIYEMAAGRPPFTGGTASDVMAAILRADPVPLATQAPGTPEDLEWCVGRALSKDREGRHRGVGDLLGDLKRLKVRLEFEAELGRVSGRQSGGVAARPGRRPRLRRAIESIAVLPLANASDDPQAEYLSDGITESIINSLLRLPKLRVVPRGTVFRYKGREVDPLEAGRELGVRAVFCGRVLQVGDSLVIKAELIDVAQESQLWGEQYRRRLTDIFAIEEEISREISEKLRLRLSGEEKRRLVQRYTESLDAYHLYLKGRYYTNKRTGEWIRKGIEHLQKAIDLDPNYALAHAGLADAYALLGSSTGGWAPREAYPRAKAAALRALALDNTLGEAHTSLGFFRLLYDWDFPAAEREYCRAIELTPSYANAHDGYGFYLKATGQHEAAIRECQQALKLDPLSLFTTLSLGWAYYFARQYDRVVEQSRKALELDPNFGFAHWHAGMGYVRQGKFDEAIAALQRAVVLAGGGPNFVAHLGHAFAVAGREEEARRVLAQLRELSEVQYVSSYHCAIICLGLGEADQAFALLERAYEERAGFLAFLRVEPMFDPVRDDARFKDLISRVRPDEETGMAHG